MTGSGRSIWQTCWTSAVATACATIILRKFADRAADQLAGRLIAVSLRNAAELTRQAHTLGGIAENFSRRRRAACAARFAIGRQIGLDRVECELDRHTRVARCLEAVPTFWRAWAPTARSRRPSTVRRERKGKAAVQQRRRSGGRCALGPSNSLNGSRSVSGDAARAITTFQGLPEVVSQISRNSPSQPS